jgi:ubiquinone/menaquinone biosynthesis C-methylase UbiE
MADQTPSKAVTGFSAWAATYDRTVAKEVEQYSGMPYTEMLRRVVEAANVAPNAQVLDVGTGTGTLALAIAERLTEGRVVGIDPTEAMLNRAREHARQAGLAGRIEFRAASVEALPFADASFDAIVSSIALHHTTVRKAVPEMVRVLKPGGRLAVADMSRNVRWESGLGLLILPLMAVYYLVTKRSIAMMRAEMAAYHQFFLKEEWEAMLRDAGLDPVEVQEFRHPTSQWYPSMLIIRADKPQGSR